MIKKIEVQGVHFDLDEKTEKYVIKKIGHIDKYLPNSVEDSVHIEVTLKEEQNHKGGNNCICEVVVHLPKENINIKEATINMFAAVDIVEAKLKQKVQQYKDLHHNGKFHRKLVARFKKRFNK
jgi:ribosomal subunit interface protein